MDVAYTDVRTQARCITAHAGSAEAPTVHGFLVASASLRGPNEVRLLRYREEESEVRCVALWAHNYEVTSLSGNPADGALLSTVYSTLDGSGGRGTVWRLPELPEEGAGAGGEDGSGGGSQQDPLSSELQRVADLPSAAAAAPGSGGSGSGSGGVDALHHLAWAPKVEEHRPGTLVSAHSGSVRTWTLEDGARLAESACARFDAEASFVGALAWDPHHPAEVAVATDGDVSVWDVRSGDKARAMGACAVAGGCVRGLSYNPNKPWHLASCSDDFRVKVWDLRRCAAPIKILDGHSSWATCVAYNPFHDQLLLSGGGDSRVDLWRVSSVSSAPLLELGEEGEGEAEEQALGLPRAATKQQEPRMAADQAVGVHKDHSDTVTGVAWSSTGAWVYASLSYTGRVAVRKVPDAEKYRVLL